MRIFLNADLKKMVTSAVAENALADGTITNRAGRAEKVIWTSQRDFRDPVAGIVIYSEHISSV